MSDMEKQLYLTEKRRILKEIDVLQQQLKHVNNHLEYFRKSSCVENIDDIFTEK